MPVFATDPGATATYQFTGRSIAWMAARAPDRGSATVYIDGAATATIDLYASTKQMRMIVFARSWSSAAAHTIRIVVEGAPASRPRVDIDSLILVAD